MIDEEQCKLECAGLLTEEEDVSILANVEISIISLCLDSGLIRVYRHVVMFSHDLA